MDKETRSTIERATQKARRLLEDEFAEQLAGDFDIMRDGRIGDEAGRHLDQKQRSVRTTVLAAIGHKRVSGMQAGQAVTDYLRDAAFTTLNRFVALKMLERRELVQECISRGDASTGFAEFTTFAPGLKLPDGSGYRLYIESVFDELSTEIRVLFDRRDPAAALWPKRVAFDGLLQLLNGPELQPVWAQDETIGWVYQYFNSYEERRNMRDVSPVPRDSRDLAIRNQFFTPDYVVRFLVENTVGSLWCQWRNSQTELSSICKYMIEANTDLDQSSGKLVDASDLSATEQTEAPRVHSLHPLLRDPRSIRVVDPACGSGHFLLTAFDMLVTIYHEAWSDLASPPFQETGRSLREDYPDSSSLKKAVPGLILRYNLYGVDIDPRCGQIAQLALWLRAQRAFAESNVTRADRPMIVRSNIVIAEPMPGEEDLLEAFLLDLTTDKIEEITTNTFGLSTDIRFSASAAIVESLSSLIRAVWEPLKLAGEMGLLLRIEKILKEAVQRGRAVWDTHLPLLGRSDFNLYASTSTDEKKSRSAGTFNFWDNAEIIVIKALEAYSYSASGVALTRRRLFAEDAAQGFALADLASRRFDVVIMNPPFGSPTERASLNLSPSSCNNLYSAFVDRVIDLCDYRVGAITDRTFMTQASFSAMRKSILGDKASLFALVDLGWGVLDANVQTAAYILDCQNGKNTSFFLDLREESDKASAILGQKDARFIDQRAFAKMPDMIIAPTLPMDVISSFAKQPSLTSLASLPRGLGSNDAKRTFRSWYEIDRANASDCDRWQPLANGGECSPFWRENSGLVLWKTAEGLLWTEALKSDKNKIYDQSGTEDYFLTGINFPKQSSDFNAAIAPPGLVPTREGKAINCNDNADGAWIAAYLNSAFVRAIIRDTTGLHKQSGSIGRIPIDDFDENEKSILSNAALNIARAVRTSYRGDETSLNFVLPSSLLSDVEIRKDAEAEWDAIDALVQAKHPEIELAWLASRPSLSFYEPRQTDLLSWCVGVAFNRFDMRLATGERPLPPIPKPYDRLPACPAGMLTLKGEQAVQASCGILVNDKGHPNDLTNAIGSILEAIGAEQSGLCAPDEVRSWLLSEFATCHLQTYSKSRRKAPIYWQFGTTNGSYSLWLYAHALTADTLHRARLDFIAPKIAHEKRLLDTMRSESYTNKEQAAKIEAQEVIVSDILAFDEEVARIAPLWQPDLDDGIPINIAPCWRLLKQNSAWQKDVKSTWDALSEGKYDWSRLAMRLWPERVIPKCAMDRSLAIGHCLENVFWTEEKEGKWKPLERPELQIESLILERTSLAIKAALKSLCDAPLASTIKRQRRTKTS